MWPLTLKKRYNYICTFTYTSISTENVEKNERRNLKYHLSRQHLLCCLPPPSFALTTNEKRQSPCFLFRFNDPIYFLVIFFTWKWSTNFPNRMCPHHQGKMPVTLFLYQIWMIWFIFTKFYAHIFVMVLKTGMPEVNIVNSVKQYPLPLIA